jgi:hypothetical protein
LGDRTRQAVAGDSEASRLIEERLLAAGYRDAHAERYSRLFVVSECRAILVGEGFPRLTAGNVPGGVVWAAYEVNLDAVSGRRIDVRTALKNMGAF